MSERASANLRQKMNEQRAASMGSQPRQLTADEIEKQKQLNELLSANVIFEAVSVGSAAPSRAGSDKTPSKPLVRHLMVRDLRRVARNMNVVLPDSGLFMDRSPIALFALFDGQSCADGKHPGPLAADWCCRNIHTKLLKNMSALYHHQTNEAAVTMMLQATFLELDQELISDQAGIQDGCGAALALLIGNRLFTAVLGKCDVVVCAPSSTAPAPKAKATPAPVRSGASASTSSSAPSPLVARSMGEGQGRCGLMQERMYLEGLGAQVFQGDIGDCVQSPSGAVASVSRSLGDPAWKAIGGISLLRAEPKVLSTIISTEAGVPAIVLASTPVLEGLPLQQFTDAIAEFPQRPRAISGEIAAEARRKRLADDPNEGGYENHYAALTVFFLPPKELPHELAHIAPKSAKVAPAPPPNKKQKLGGPEMNSVRLRHVLVRHSDSKEPFDPVRQVQVTRLLGEADSILRQALREILQEQTMQPPSTGAKKDALVHLQQTPKALGFIKNLSECDTAKKGGNVSGDLGWMAPEALRASYGAKVADAAKTLEAGQWSDLVDSDLGVHLMQRIA